MSLVAAALAIAPGAGAFPSTARPSPPEDRLVFAVRNDSVVEKTFTIEHGLVAQKVLLEGEEEAQLSERRLEIASKFELEVSDTYRKVDAGRPLELRRLLESASLHVDLTTADARGATISDVWEAETPLKGKSAVYVWVPEEKGYGRHYDETESLEEYLEDLSEDLDLRSLLPDGEVRVGGDWKPELSRLVDVFVPNGHVPLRFVKGGQSPFVRALAAGVGGPLGPVFGGVIKGNAQARWVETREVAGDRLARIELAVTIETDHDRTEAARARLLADDAENAYEIEHSSVRWKFEGTGTLQWNLGAGRFETLELVGREDVTSDIAMRVGTEVSRQLISMAGSLKVSARAGAKKKPESEIKDK